MKKTGLIAFFLSWICPAPALEATYTTVCDVTCASDSEGTRCGITECETVAYYTDTGRGSGGGESDDGSGGGGTPAWNEVMSCWKDICASNRITSVFGGIRSGATCGFHTGVDIGTAAEGGKIPFRSMTSGTVDAIGYQEKGAGFYIRVRNDNGSYTVYCHLDGNKEKGDDGFNNSANITKGMRVVAGTWLGTTDTTGETTGPHLDVKVYFPGNRSVSEVQEEFGIVLSSSDVRYCSVRQRTYINPVQLTGGQGCN